MDLTLVYHDRERGWSSPLPAVDSPTTLVLVFSAPERSGDREVLEAIAAAYPLVTIAGCTTAGEIGGPTIRDQSIGVAIVRFATTQLRLARAAITGPENSLGAGEALAHELAAPDLRGVFVLADGLQVNGSALARGLARGLPEGVSVTGGLAADGPRFEHTAVLVDGAFTEGFVTAIGLYGDRLQIAHGSVGGWDPFGPRRRVTRADANVLYELDERPALELYRRYLGDRAAGLPATGLLFPLALVDDEGAPPIVRTLLAIAEAEQSLTFAGEIPQGSRVRLMKANLDRLVASAETACEQALTSTGDATPVLALAVSCVGRRLVLTTRTAEETEAIHDRLPPGLTPRRFLLLRRARPPGGRPLCSPQPDHDPNDLA